MKNPIPYVYCGKLGRIELYFSQVVEMSEKIELTPGSIDEKDILSHILNISHKVTQIKDLDLLLENILTESRKMCHADAGSIYVKLQNNMLEFCVSQNDTLQEKLPPGKKLIFSKFTIPVNQHSIAGFVTTKGTIVNIPDVYLIGDDQPFRFDKKYDKLSEYRTQSMLCLPLINQQNETLGVLQLINALDEKGDIISFSQQYEDFLMHFANAAAVALERAQMTRAIILRMLRMSELRDPKETGAHVNRVGAIAAEIYEAWATKRKIPKSEIDKNKDLLRLTSMLHDVGKVAISDKILKKPARLTKEEFDTMKHHTFLGAKLFADSRSDFDEAAFYIALEHHEKWNGSGYPGKVTFEKINDRNDYDIIFNDAPPKKGEEIHLFSRVTAVADVYDALSSKRAYKEAWEQDTIIETLKADSGSHFDPEVIDAFLDVYDMVLHIRQQFPG